MARIRVLAASLLVAGALALGGPASAQDADTPLDKAIQQLEALLTRLRADPSTDPKLIASLEDIAAQQRRAREAGSGAAAGGSATGGGGIPGAGGAGLPGGEAIFKLTLATFLEGTNLKDDDRSAAEAMLREFVIDYNLAKTQGDDKSKPVIREHTEKRIARSFPPKDANRMKDNLDTIIKRWEWSGGRRGK